MVDVVADESELDSVAAQEEEVRLLRSQQMTAEYYIGN